LLRGAGESIDLTRLPVQARRAAMLIHLLSRQR
jgi:hypothetical protein